MVLQADSVQVEAAEEESLQNPVVHTGELTPRKVLSWLPRNATPAQQDSMIRAHIKPSEIRWSTMPDTLHLPGHPAGKSFRDVSLPQYYRESFFSKDSLFHPELRGGRMGVSGDPVPYSVSGDNFVTSLLLLCFVLACVAFAQSREFILRQLRKFFYTPRFGTTEISETSTEVPTLLGAANLFVGSHWILSLFSSINQRHIYHRAVSGDSNLCWSCGFLFSVQGIALFCCGMGVL